MEKITQLDQCTLDASAIKELRRPEKIREHLAAARAEILHDVEEFLQIDGISGVVDNLLSPLNQFIGLCRAVERDHRNPGSEHKAYDQLPPFGMLNDSLFCLIETVKFIAKIGEGQDTINRLQEFLCLQRESEGHTIIKD